MLLKLTMFGLIVHLAKSVIAAVIGLVKLKAVANVESEYHPEKLYPALLGVGGAIAVELQKIS